VTQDDLRLTQLGAQCRIPHSPEAASIETVPNYDSDTPYIARFTAPEFTSMCPVTGQPDFARFVIDYAPNQWLIESKSLKLFLASFRNHGDFHESCSTYIARRLFSAAEPHFMRVCGFWYPRGGIPIDVFWQQGELPKGVYLPDPSAHLYTGR
jgi:7-cyano-7-deazaguanine reductase